GYGASRRSGDEQRRATEQLYAPRRDGRVHDGSATSRVVHPEGAGASAARAFHFVRAMRHVPWRHIVERGAPAGLRRGARRCHPVELRGRTGVRAVVPIPRVARHHHRAQRHAQRSGRGTRGVPHAGRSRVQRMTSSTPRPVRRALDDAALADAEAALREANLRFTRSHPGEHEGRQPVHTVYGGAQLFAADTTPKLGAIAWRALDEFAPNAKTLGDALGIAGHPALERLYTRLADKLRGEPVEDYRVDFEDGYGNRPDSEEDHHAGLVARELSRGIRDGSLPAFIGLRVKPLTEELRQRSVRTLDLVLTSLA